MSLICISGLTSNDIRSIWSLASSPHIQLTGTVGWSFEGNGIRTRTTFTQAFRDLGLAYTELPNVLKTDERPCDLAGYLDPFYDLYVIRESNHDRLSEFAAASRRPVINAMSSAGHPCEVLSDVYYIETEIAPLNTLQIGLWGPTTNVFRSWHELAGVLGITLRHYCPREFHSQSGHVAFSDRVEAAVDILITDSWPAGFDSPHWTLTEEHMESLGSPRLLPTPPFRVGQELGFDPVATTGFLGYEQKKALIPTQRAILQHMMGKDRTL